MYVIYFIKIYYNLILIKSLITVKISLLNYLYQQGLIQITEKIFIKLPLIYLNHKYHFKISHENYFNILLNTIQ